MSKFSIMLSCLREGDYLSFMVILFSSLFVIFCCSPIHELAHAYVAYKCGDDTAKYKGRLTINPMAHVDLIGAVMIVLFGIGYAKPVPVNPAKLKHPRRDMALTALAGPVANLLMGFVSAFIVCAVVRFGGDSLVTSAIAQFFLFSATINVSLAAFNLLPIPPLDGSKIYSSILPDKIYFKIMKYDRYIMIGFMLLLFTGVFNGIIGVISDILLNIISFIPRMIFGVEF
ncbi:MAG: site-2 protease family protein [Clostridium sp.]|nr:site-2 protease family protein [Clostridium sp.]